MRKPRARNSTRRPNKHLDLLGKRFNHLIVEEFFYNETNRTYYAKLKCECGNYTTATPLSLKQNKRFSCGKVGCEFFHRKRRDSAKKAAWTGCGDIWGSKWSMWRLAAAKRGLEFSITVEQAWELFLQQDKRCALSGVPLTFGSAHARSSVTASPDRIDSSIGYVEGNVQWVHKDINVMKRSLSDIDFIEWCRKVVNHDSTKVQV